MKIVIFFLVCMAWIKCAKAPYTPPLDPYTRLMLNDIVRRSRPTQIRNLRGKHFDVRHGDNITIYKVIDSKFAPDDAVHGLLRRFIIDDHNLMLGHAPPILGQHGEVQVMLGDGIYVFDTPLKQKEGYVDRGHNEGEAEYFCTIAKGEMIFLVAILRKPGEPLVSYRVPRVEFANHLFPHVPHTVFTGQLFKATTSHSQELISNL